MIHLTEEQQRELGKAEPAKFVDPRTDETYVLVRADLYECMRAIIDGATKRAGWDDAALDAYEQYRKAKEFSHGITRKEHGKRHRRKGARSSFPCFSVFFRGLF